MSGVKGKSGLKPGTTNNPNGGGRKKGSLNKNTIEVKEWMNSILDSNRIQFAYDLKTVDAEKRLDILVRLAIHLVPKAINKEEVLKTNEDRDKLLEVLGLKNK